MVREFIDADDWRATKAAWDVRADYDNWLAGIGEQHREPKRSELDMDAAVAHEQTETESYRVITDKDEVHGVDQL